MLEEFQPVSPIEETTINQYADSVPPELAELWRTKGAGFIGDGYFRLVDPARAAKMMSPFMKTPGPVILLTAMADFVYTTNGVFLVVKPRFNSTEPAQISFDQLLGLLEPNPTVRQNTWDWEPYPQAATQGGVPGFEECYGFVPLLAVGGRPDPANLQKAGVYQHIGICGQLGGGFHLTRMLPTPVQP
jgi:hypothetical protein